jgi:hypothetical protein
MKLSFTTQNTWFENNILTLNCNKTHFMQFTCKPGNNINLSLNYNNNRISNTRSTKFLELMLDTHLTWRIHIDYLHSKLSLASYPIRILKSLMPLSTLTNIYFSYFHSMSYGIIFWGTSSHSHSIFKLQKKVIRLIKGTGNRDSCCRIFKELKILPFYCQYIFSLLLFFIKNNEIHSICTRHSDNLHPPLLHLTKAQKGVYFSGIKVYNSSPQSMKQLSYDAKKFKVTSSSSFIHIP